MPRRLNNTRGLDTMQGSITTGSSSGDSAEYNHILLPKRSASTPLDGRSRQVRCVQNLAPPALPKPTLVVIFTIIWHSFASLRMSGVVALLAETIATQFLLHIRIST